MTVGTSRIFRSTDAGAPQFSETNGTLANVLKIVLVDGYTDHPSLDWELVYSATNKIVVRPKQGLRQFVRFNDAVTVSPGTVIEISTFSTMSSVDYGVDRMPDIGTLAYWHKRYSSGSANVPWMIIGDEVGFYLITRPAYPTYTNTQVAGALWQAWYVGEYPVWNIANKWNFCMLADVTPNYAGMGGIQIGSTSNYVKRGSSLSKGITQIRLLGTGTASLFSQNYRTTPTAGTYPINGVYPHSPVRIQEYNSPSVLLGNMPGLFDPIGTAFGISPTYASIVPIEYTDAFGKLNILLWLSSSVGQTTDSSMQRVIFKVGAGFRNVL